MCFSRALFPLTAVTSAEKKSENTKLGSDDYLLHQKLILKASRFGFISVDSFIAGVFTISTENNEAKFIKASQRLLFNFL